MGIMGGLRIPFMLVVLALGLVALCASALQENLAGIVDWHKPLIGRPLLVPTPPRLISDRVVAITDSNVFAALDSKTGDVAWRYKLEDVDPVVSYHVQGNGMFWISRLAPQYQCSYPDIILLSGPSGSTVRSFSLATGQVQWEYALHDTGSITLTTPVHLGTDVAFTPDGSAVVILSDGQRITKLNLADGALQWSMNAPGAGSTVLFKQILVTGDIVHTLAVTHALDGLTLTTLSLSLQTSVPLGDFTQIPSLIANPSQALLATASVDGSARVVWLEHGRIRSAYLSEAGQLGGVKEALPGNGHVYASIIGEARQHGLVLGQKRNGAVQVVNVLTGKPVEEFKDSHHSAEKSLSVYSISPASDGVSFTRLFWSYDHGLAVSETKTVEKETVTITSTFPFDTISHGVVLAATGSADQYILTTSSGAIVSVEGQETKWVREEALADLAAVRFVDLAEVQEDQVRQLADEDYLSRVTRHLSELKDLPAYLLRFAKRFTGDYASTLATPALDPTNLHRDRFGQQKLLIALGRHGKVFALDSSNGNVIWSRNLGLTGFEKPELESKGLWIVREVGEGVNPTLAVIAERTHDDSVETVGFHLDAFTGKFSGEAHEVTGLPLGKTIFEGKSKTIFPTPYLNCGTNNRVLAVVDNAEKLHIFPSCATVASEIEKASSDIFFYLTSHAIDGTTLKGYTLSTRDGTTFPSTEVWSSVLPGTLVVNSPVAFDAVASFGRVKGDKSTLYKYLNPHLVVLATVSPKEGTAGVYVVDTVTGRKIYEVALRNVVGDVVRAALSENWLVYSWLDTQGWRVASVELYEVEGQSVTPGLSSFSHGHDVVPYSQTYIAPGEIKELAITTSKSGITAKELVYVNARDQIASIPYRLLDPRRPVGKPTKAEKEEMLIPYEPLLPFDPRRVISHTNQVLGASHLVSSPTLMESTSFLLAYGLDIFSTRGLHPSGTFDILTDSFNKVQLLLTLAALSVGIFIARPAVARKLLRAKWF